MVFVLSITLSPEHSFSVRGVVKILSFGHFEIYNHSRLWPLHGVFMPELHYITKLLRAPTLPRPWLSLYSSCSVPVTVPGEL